MIDPRRLLILRIFARVDSIAEAARLLHLTPPAVSQQLSALEREAGVALIDRSGRSARLTAAGRMLARNADRIHAELIDAERQLADLTGHVRGPVRVSAFQSAMPDLVAPAASHACSRHPALQLSIVEQYGEPALTALRRGDLDIVIHEHDRAEDISGMPGLVSNALLFDRYIVVIPRSWRRHPATIEDLRDQPWVGGPVDTSCDVALRRLLASFNAEGQITDSCVEFPSVLALVAAGRGAALVPHLALQDAQVASCPDIDVGGRVIAAIYRNQPAPPAAPVAAVLDALATTAQRLVV